METCGNEGRIRLIQTRRLLGSHFSKGSRRHSAEEGRRWSPSIGVDAKRNFFSAIAVLRACKVLGYTKLDLGRLLIQLFSQWLNSEKRERDLELCDVVYIYIYIIIIIII